MRQNTFKILFYIKKTRVLKDGRNPLYLRITVNGVREETSISQSIDPKLWDSKKGCAKGNKPEASTINFLLEDIRGSLTNIRRQIERDGEPLSAKLVMDVYTGKINPQKTLVEVFTVYNKKFWEKTKAGLKATATAKRYDRTLLYLQQFMKSEYKSDDIHLNRLNPSFITNFEHFLFVKKGCAHNASKKYLKLLRTIIIDALANGWIKKDPFYSISTAEKKTIPTSLTLLEVEKILNKQFESRCLNKIKGGVINQLNELLPYFPVL